MNQPSVRHYHHNDALTDSSSRRVHSVAMFATLNFRGKVLQVLDGSCNPMVLLPMLVLKVRSKTIISQAIS